MDGAIVVDETTGIVVCTEKTKELTKEQCDEIIDSCPYNIPRRDAATSMLAKCDMCIDRVHAGLIPMCVKTCCTGAMNFGEQLEKVVEKLNAQRSSELILNKVPIPGDLIVFPNPVNGKEVTAIVQTKGKINVLLQSIEGKTIPITIVSQSDKMIQLNYQKILVAALIYFKYKTLIENG